MDRTELAVAVEDAFARTARGLERWDDPHPPPDRIVADEEYSRVTNPAKWRIVGARVDAWLEVLVTHGLASVERDATVTWDEPHATNVTMSDVVTPAVRGGLRLVVGRTRIESVDDAGIRLGVGDPAICIGWFPDCGCDACDSGSQDAIDEIDRHLRAVVTGTFRHLTAPGRRRPVGGVVRDRSITVLEPGSWSASNVPGRHGAGVDAVLADPTGWREWSGPSWSEA